MYALAFGMLWLHSVIARSPKLNLFIEGQHSAVAKAFEAVAMIEFVKLMLQVAGISMLILLTIMLIIKRKEIW